METELWKQSYRLPNGYWVMGPTIFELWVMELRIELPKLAIQTVSNFFQARHSLFNLPRKLLNLNLIALKSRAF